MESEETTSGSGSSTSTELYFATAYRVRNNNCNILNTFNHRWHVEIFSRFRLLIV